MAFDPARAKSLFLAASSLTDSAARAAFLDCECGGDAELRGRIEALLRASESDPEFGAEQAGSPQTSMSSGVEQAPTTYSPSQDEQAGAIIAGRYTLVDAIGEGGMGSVWRAKQVNPVKRYVAIKLIKAGMDSKQVLARFDAERQALALMDHPNIAKVFDGGLHAQRPFFVMELVKGMPITEYCDAHKLCPRQRLELFAPVCEAIQHAHQKGIIHRDIKPSNVLVALYDDKPVVKVIDFGVAKATGGALTEQTLDTAFGGVIGTPQYMSPEQATFNNSDIDTRSDVYALGVLLYELLTGSPPFTTDELAKRGLFEMLRVVREVEPPRPSTRLSTADALPTIAANRGTEPLKLTGLLRNELDWIVMRALEKDRSRRYATANGLAADVRRYLSGEVVEAHPPSAAYRLQKFVRRNQAQVLAASLVFAALVAGVIVAGIGLIYARSSAENERQAKIEADRRRDQAEKALARTADVLDTMVSEVTGDSLTTQQEVTAEQKKFLTEVLKYYQEFAGENSDDETTRARTANAAFRVGSIENRLGRLEEGATAYCKARDGYSALVSDFPAVVAYRQRLAASHGNLANLLATLGKPSEAKEQFHKALAIHERLAAEFPEVPGYGQQLAGIHNNLGNLLEEQGQRQRAEEHYRKALVIKEKLAAEFPEIPAYRQQLAGNHNNLGLLLGDSRRWQEAEDHYRRALAIMESLAAEFPAIPAYRQLLAGNHHNLGLLFGDLRRWQEAEDHYRKALAIQEKLATEFPAAPKHREDLAVSRSNLGDLLKKRGQRQGAEEHYRSVLVIHEKLVAEFPEIPAYRQRLAGGHNNLGLLLFELRRYPEAEEQYRKAIQIQERLAAEFPAVSDYRLDLGGSYCNFGTVVQIGGQPADSLKWIAKAIEVLAPIHEQEPGNAAARQFLRNSHANRGKAHDQLRQYKEAILDWNTAIELSPHEEQPQFIAARATSRFNAGEVTEAVADWERLLELGPENPEILNRLAWKLVATPDREGRYPLAGKAVAWAQRGCELAPANGNLLKTLGVALYRNGQWQPSIDALRKSLGQGADIPQNWLFIAMAYWRLEDKAQAQHWYDKSLVWRTANQPAATADQELESLYAEAARLMASPDPPAR